MRKKKQQLLNQTQQITQQFQRNSPLNTSRHTNSTHLHQIKMINKYLKVNKPIINAAHKEAIQKKLELEKQAELQAEKRIKKNQYFIKYHYNPIFDKENRKVNHSSSQIIKGKSAKRLERRQDRSQEGLEVEVSLIDAIGRQKEHNLSKHISSLHLIQNTASNVSLAVNYCFKDSHYKLHRRPTPKPMQETKTRQLTFQEILTIPDRNYYADRQKTINIFEFMTGNSSNIVTKDILLRYHFNFTHCVEKIDAYKFPIFRDLSRLGRSLANNSNITKNGRLDVLVSGEMNFNGNDIRFNDLMSVSSGRLDHSLVYSVLNGKNAQIDNSPNSSIVDEQTIIYEDYQRQFSMNVKNQRSLKEENEDYLNFMVSPSEERERKKYHKLHENVEKNLKEMKKSYELTIEDRKLHENYHALIANDLSFLVDFGKKGQRSPVQADTMVRGNKKKKTRHQRLKIKEVLSTIQMKNQYQQKLKEFIQVQKRK